MNSDRAVDPISTEHGSAAGTPHGWQDREEALVVRYGELSLKGGNRARFERALVSDLAAALSGTPGLTVGRIRGRVLAWAGVPVTRLVEPACRVFGVTSVSPARQCPSELPAIEAAAASELAEALERRFPGAGPVPFRVSARRALKEFPLDAAALERRLGQDLMARFPRLRADLDHPALDLGLDLRAEGSWVYSQRQDGPGGLPAGVAGRALCLLSGGIDSPVAAWLAMKRGLRVDFVSFYSFPYVGPQTREKLIRQVERLCDWQRRARLYLVPFAAYQCAIRDRCPAPYRTVLYRRAMQRVAAHLAKHRRYRALITGESLGQVASQTLENLALIEQASELPVLRPLITNDKLETVALARRIGTLEISNLPAPDCCTVFQPERPVTRGTLDEVQAAEAALDLETLTRDAFHLTECLRFPAPP